VAESAEDVIQRELDERERLLWAGRPRKCFLLRTIDAIVMSLRPVATVTCPFETRPCQLSPNQAPGGGDIRASSSKVA
jgi:hypothetical protein